MARLEDAGYLTTSVAPQETRPTRKMLHITPAGARAFQSWRTAPVVHGRDLRQEFLAKLYFAQHAGPETVTALIDGQRRVCRASLATLTARADQAADPYSRLVYTFRCSQLTACLDWLDECAATTREMQPDEMQPARLLQRTV
jgi:hypothetical protein